ncbi:MAG TPA: isoleucine--tRNA ligase [Kineosporiaceae bacterium]|nr:isoleucine--tRNA ligase [Kineosporiaceae bacterium]
MSQVAFSAVFTPLPDKPAHAELELSILDRWREEATFERVRAANRGGPKFSFIDGPVTANKTLGVHTAWGRTLKDVFQRYKALRGHDQRYQNGFDCQGLWIEVGVEKSLGLNSKREIEAYGLKEFAARCREVAEWSAKQITAGSIRLGQWMDWPNSYFTNSDTNIEYIWRFLSTVHDRGMLYRGHRITEWCPRCGTSISAHELTGSYVDRDDPSLFVRFPLLERPDEALVIWTTTPWTLPANVAAAVNPQARYGLRDGAWTAVDPAQDESGYQQVVSGAQMVGWRYAGPFDALGPGADVDHRVIGWDDVTLDEGTGIVHIAPGCGVEDFEQGRLHDLPVLTPVDEAGQFLPEYGWLAGRQTSAAADAIIEDLRTRGILVRAGVINHRYPECWRCHTPLIFRISDDWFIGVDEIRGALREANDTVEWTPSSMGRRMDDWLINMSDWNISRRRYYGLPLPFYPCACGRLNVVSSKAELLARATAEVTDLAELRRPWIDEILIGCADCGDPVRRIEEVGDVWLDAGIVPFSTLGWGNETAIPQGFATGAAAGLTTADLPDDAYWQEWFPADWVSEMREQTRLWFYSQLFMSVVLTGRAPYRKVLGYEKMLDDTGREMHGSHGNMIEAEAAFERMGADVMRWQYCMQPPTQNLLFGYGPGQEIQRKLLTLWNSVSFFVQYANIAGFTPAGLDPPAVSHELDRWAVARTAQLVTEAGQAYESYLTVGVIRAFESYLDDLSNWYIRRSRRRFWAEDEAAHQTLWYCLVTSLQVMSPVMPFLTEHLWKILVADVLPGAPDSVFLAGWPQPSGADEALLAEMTLVRRVVNLGRQARASAQLRGRQPLRTLAVEGADGAQAYADIVADELRVKEVRFGRITASQLSVRPNLRLLGPRLGRDLPAVRQALSEGRFEALPDGSIAVGERVFGPDEVLIDRSGKDGWEMTGENGVIVAIDTNLDDDLRREARLLDVVHQINSDRRDAGMSLTERISVALPASDADLLGYRERLMAETLASVLTVSDDDQLRIVSVDNQSTDPEHRRSAPS